jgi:hypothetical protein
MGSYLKKKKYFFLAAIREKHNFQYFENLTDNLTFHLPTEKYVKFMSEMVCLPNA